jgi:hypothetical protein
MSFSNNFIDQPSGSVLSQNKTKVDLSFKKNLQGEPVSSNNNLEFTNQCTKVGEAIY